MNSRIEPEVGIHLKAHMEEEKVAVIVIDNGTNLSRAGFAGKKDPKVVFPSIIGSPIYNNVGIYEIFFSYS